MRKIKVSTKFARIGNVPYNVAKRYETLFYEFLDGSYSVECIIYKMKELKITNLKYSYLLYDDVISRYIKYLTKGKYNQYFKVCNGKLVIFIKTIEKTNFNQIEKPRNSVERKIFNLINIAKKDYYGD